MIRTGFGEGRKTLRFFGPSLRKIKQISSKLDEETTLHFFFCTVYFLCFFGMLDVGFVPMPGGEHPRKAAKAESRGD